jgi:hypothetical protein
MRFFTPELYLRYNSPDDAVADRADEEWEAALREYMSYLAQHSQDMNERVRELAQNANLHDAELLSVQEDLPESPLPLRFWPLPIATISVEQDGIITNMVYLLWSEVEQMPPASNWPFSECRKHWLYDEVEVEPQHAHWRRYWHRILWSDGSVMSVPFFDVIIHTFSTEHPEGTVVAKRRA